MIRAPRPKDQASRLKWEGTGRLLGAALALARGVNRG